MTGIPRNYSRQLACFHYLSICFHCTSTYISTLAIDWKNIGTSLLSIGIRKVQSLAHSSQIIPLSITVQEIYCTDGNQMELAVIMQQFLYCLIQQCPFSTLSLSTTSLLGIQGSVYQRNCDFILHGIGCAVRYIYEVVACLVVQHIHRLYCISGIYIYVSGIVFKKTCINILIHLFSAFSMFLNDGIDIIFAQNQVVLGKFYIIIVANQSVKQTFLINSLGIVLTCSLVDSKITLCFRSCSSKLARYVA